MTDALGWPAALAAPAIVARVVALNAARGAEEATGQVRWLRPAYQAPIEIPLVEQAKLDITQATDTGVLPPWPTTEADRYVALRSLLASTPRRPHSPIQARTCCEIPRNVSVSAVSVSGLSEFVSAGRRHRICVLTAMVDRESGRLLETRVHRRFEKHQRLITGSQKVRLSSLRERPDSVARAVR